MRASITRLTTKLGELEGSTDQPDTLDLAKRMTAKLEGLQEAVDEHDDNVAQLYRYTCSTSDRCMFKISRIQSSQDSVETAVAFNVVICRRDARLTVTSRQ